MKMLPLVLCATMLFLCCALHAEDVKLAELDARLAAADSQMELNTASGEIAKYLDSQLVEQESAILRDLDSEEAGLFTIASMLWREYRTAQVKPRFCS